jgi:ABC-type transport system involved in multi-copper enzyme maturation permease subunit
MLAAYINSLREAVNRRMALVLFGMAILMAFLLTRFIVLVPLKDGTTMLFMGRQPLGPASLAVPAVLAAVVRMTGGLWLFLSIFASTPLLVSMLEKGWVELTLTKGVARWRVLLGCYFGGLTLFAATLMIATFPPAIYLWAKTGVGFRPLVMAIVLQTFAFASLMAIAALTTLTQTGAALPIIFAVVVDFLTPLLTNRNQTFYRLISSNWGRGIVDWVYRILPKNNEIIGQSESYIQLHTFGPAWPYWTTGVFIVAVMGLTIYLLHRKSL